MNFDPQQPRAADGRFVLLFGQSVRDAVKIEYEADILSLAELGRKFGVSPATIDTWKRRYRWRPRQPRAIDPTDLTSRMLEVLSAQIAELEGAMTTGVNEVEMLSKLVRTLDKVLLLKERTTPVDRPKSSKEAEQLRAKIAERIRELNGD